MKDINKDDLRWSKGDYTIKDQEKMTYLETLQAICNYYGTFCGRWHDNKFWHKTLRESYSLTEKGAKKRVFKIENEADGELEEWRQYQ